MKLKIEIGNDTVLAGALPTAVTDFNTGQPKLDVVTGEPTYAVSLIILADDGAELLVCKVPGMPRGITVGAAVTVENLVATPWEVGGKSGVAFRASKITAVGPVGRKEANPDRGGSS